VCSSDLLTRNHKLQATPPTDPDAAIAYSYDPNHPAVRVDIAWRGQIADGLGGSDLGQPGDPALAEGAGAYALEWSPEMPVQALATYEVKGVDLK
jgi:hypothetical protein